MSDQQPWDLRQTQGRSQYPTQQAYPPRPPQYGQQGPAQQNGPPTYQGQPYPSPSAEPPYPPGYSYGPRPPRRHQNSAGLLVLGVSAVGVAAAGAWVPFLHLGTDHLSVSTAHGVCSSTLGQYAQALSGRVQLDCTAVTAGYWGALVVGVAGLVLVVMGIIRASAERPAGLDRRPPYSHS